MKLLDLGVQKAFRFSNSRYQLELILDAFNVFNINTITAFNSNNRSSVGFVQPQTIVAPRVYRVGARVTF